MDPFYYLIEVIAIIAGILIVLTPLVLRFFRGNGRKAGVRRATGEGAEDRNNRGETAAPGPLSEKGGEVLVLSRSEKIDNYIRRVQQAGTASAGFGTGEFWPPEAAGEGSVGRIEPAEQEGIVTMPALTATRYMEAEVPAAGSEGWRRVNRLPPLKRAIMLQALLGPPKGIQDAWFDG
jgi:hypothetical protein